MSISLENEDMPEFVWMIAVGGLSEGFEFVGPFTYLPDALEYADQHLQGYDWSIETLSRALAKGVDYD